MVKKLSEKFRAARKNKNNECFKIGDKLIKNTNYFLNQIYIIFTKNCFLLIYNRKRLPTAKFYGIENE